MSATLNELKSTDMNFVWHHWYGIWHYLACEQLKCKKWYLYYKIYGSKYFN